MIKTYWDHEERERAAMTREEVERFLDAELMTKGVLRVTPLVLDEEPEISEPKTDPYYQIGSVAFPNAAAAEDFLKLGAVSVGSRYLGVGYRNYITVAERIDPDMTEKRLVSETEFANRKSDLERRAAIRDANEKRSTEHAAACKEQDKVLNGVWEDWYHCRNVDEAHRRVVSTFESYVSTAGGDRLTAARFLGKVFTFEQISDAREWCGVDIPDPDSPELAPAPMPAPQPEVSLDF